VLAGGGAARNRRAAPAALGLYFDFDVGLPRESRISRAKTAEISVMMEPWESRGTRGVARRVIRDQRPLTRFERELVPEGPDVVHRSEAASGWEIGDSMRPYPRVAARRSRRAITPPSFRVRTSRPKPCLSKMPAQNGILRKWIASLALDLGTTRRHQRIRRHREGDLVEVTKRNACPGTSTPSQKLHGGDQHGVSQLAKLREQEVLGCLAL